MTKWSIKHDKCVMCGTNKKRHMAKGLCIYCYLKQYHANPDPKKQERFKAQKWASYSRKKEAKG